MVDEQKIIETVSFLSIEREDNNFADPFKESAEILKNMSGVSPSFKGNTTRKINKMRHGIGGAKSQQIEEEAGYTGYQMLDVVLPPYNMNYLAKLYEISSSNYAAVNAKVSNIVGLGYRLVETSMIKRLFEDNSGNENKTKKARKKLEIHREELKELIESLNKEDTFTEVLMKVWIDYESMGNGFIEIGRKKNGEIGYIGHIRAQTVRVRKNRDGFVQISGHKLQFFANYGDVFDDDGKYSPVYSPTGGGKANEIIHIKKYSPLSGYYGIPDIISAKSAVAGDEFAARFNLDYFENKAVPRHLITLKGASLSAVAEARLLKFFETGLKGTNHRSIFIPLPADTTDSKVELKIEAIEAEIQDGSFEKYRASNRTEILMVHRVPLSKVSTAPGISLALAKDADKTFKEQVCAPQQKIFERKINRIVKEFSDSLEIKLEEMTLTDADTQSKIDERRVKTGIDLPNEIRSRDGKPEIPGGDERVDLNAKDKVAQAQAEIRTQRERDSARSAESTDSNGSARNAQGEGRAVS